MASIAVLVDPSGERTMLSDRGGCVELSDPDERWLDGVTTLHVPLYSLEVDPLAATAISLIGRCRDRRIDVGIDVSSVALIEGLGVEHVHELLDALRPAVVFANRDEARVLGIEGPVAGAVTVVKQGADPAVVFEGGRHHQVPPARIDADDTTGAGDAFAAGFLTADWRADVAAACHEGHRAAALALRPHGAA